MDSAELEKCYETNHIRWIRVAVEWGAGRQSAEDMVHDVMVWLLEGVDGPSSGEALEDAVERLIRRRVSEGRREQEEQATLPRTPTLDQLDERGIVHGAVAALSPAQQTVVWRCLTQGATERMVAQELGVHPGTVQVHLRRARRHLQTQLEGLGAGRKIRHERRPRRDR
jgi:RNA polymerase sigma factor (sigma-70 family)